MKKTLFILISILALSCAKESETKYSTDAEKAFLVVTKNTTKSELFAIATEFKQKRNINIDFSNSIFSDKGEIRTLELNVDCNDGFKGKTTCTTIMLAFKNTGFIRDYSKNAKSAFSIGSME